MNLSRSSSLTKYALLLIVLSFFLYFSGLGSYGLLEPDEGRYSEIPREMLESGDFVTPRLNYVKYFEKPVLHYWLTAAAFSVFGENEFASRFWPALLALGSVLTAWILARRLYDSKAAFFSSLILATSLLHFAIGRINIIDMPLSFFLTVAMTGCYFGMEKNRKFHLVFYSGMALALLTKGLIGIVLPGGILFWYILLTRRWNLLRNLLYAPGILLFFVLTVPWFAEVCRRNNDFFYFFFIQEHFLRYATTMHGRYAPVWFFIPILIVGFFPWAGLLPGALRSAIPLPLRTIGKAQQKELFLFLWFAVIFVFFSISSSKLIPYIVPVLPPLAILMGRYFSLLIEEENVRKTGRFLLWNSLLLVPFIGALLVYPFFNDRISAGRLLPYSLPVAAVLVLFVYSGWHCLLRRNFRKLAVLLCILSFANIFAFGRVFLLYDSLLSARELAVRIDELRREGDVIAQFGNYDQGLPFYLKQRIVLANYMGELEFGARREADPSWFIREQALKELWAGDNRLILIVNRDHRTYLTKILEVQLPAPVIETEKRLVFTNRQ
jgi:4-amino-4-deoxy-L-arabinose transferase-like glycosyltransferase